MEFSSLLDTSLNLSAKPLSLRVTEEALPPPPLPPPKQEAQSKFIDFGSRNATAPAHEEKGALALVEEINRVSAENKKLTDMLTTMSENYSQLRSKLADYTSKSIPTTRKRKAESSNNNVDGTSVSSSSDDDEESWKKTREEVIKAKISQTHVRTEASDTGLIVKDGYQWRKYGQKVTRDNPSPRAYFKCSFAPSCPVKKKVQRSVEDQSIVVATYEGEHNHPHPSKAEAPANRSSTPGNLASPSPLAPRITLDLTKPNQETVASSRGKGEAATAAAPHLPHYLVEQMASTLTKDPTFKAALAAAISGKFLQQNSHTEKW